MKQLCTGTHYATSTQLVCSKDTASEQHYKHYKSQNAFLKTEFCAAAQ